MEDSLVGINKKGLQGMQPYKPLMVGLLNLSHPISIWICYWNELKPSLFL
jgi:hypothetical protein